MTKTYNIDFFDPEYGNPPEVGMIGFVVSNHNGNTGAETTTLRDRPAKTNISFEAKVHGWCGSYNNVSTHAEGIARIVKVFKNGRVKIEILTRATSKDDDLDFRLADPSFEEVVTKFLEETGYEDTWNWE